MLPCYLRTLMFPTCQLRAKRLNFLSFVFVETCVNICSEMCFSFWTVCVHLSNYVFTSLSYLNLCYHANYALQYFRNAICVHLLLINHLCLCKHASTTYCHIVSFSVHAMFLASASASSSTNFLHMNQSMDVPTQFNLKCKT